MTFYGFPSIFKPLYIVKSSNYVYDPKHIVFYIANMDVLKAFCGGALHVACSENQIKEIIYKCLAKQVIKLI